VVLKYTVKGRPKVDVLLITFLQLGYGWNFETLFWQILVVSVRKLFYFHHWLDAVAVELVW